MAQERKGKGKVNVEKKSIYEQLAEKVIMHIQEGKTAPWRSGIKANIAVMPPHNALSKHIYRGVNHAETMLLTMINNWSTTGFLTFKKINELGGRVKANEKGTPLVRYYTVFRDSDGNIVKPIPGESKEEFMSRVDQVIPVPSLTAPVFNLDQTEGLEHIRDKYIKAAEAAKTAGERDAEGRTPFEKMQLEIITAFEDRLRETVELKKVQRSGPPCYLPLQHRIDQVDISLYKGIGFYAEDCLHESGHSTMWKLERVKTPDDLAKTKQGTAGYAKEELVAELSSMFMATKLGLETSFENSANYISGWGLRLALQENPKILFEAAREAEKAADYLLNDELMEKVNAIRAQHGFQVDFSDVDAIVAEMEKEKADASMPEEALSEDVVTTAPALS